MYWSMLLGARAIEVNKTGRNSCSSHAYVLVGREGHLKKKKVSLIIIKLWGKGIPGRGKEELKSGVIIGDGVRKVLMEETVEQRSKGGEGEKRVDI